MPEITQDLVRSLCPVRPSDGHKGTFGMALIIAGHRNMTGAQVLAASSALRSGVGLVKVMGPSDSLLPTKINCPCALFSEFPEKASDTARFLEKELQRVSSVAIGPGTDTEDIRIAALIRSALGSPVKLVLDAGALTVIAKDKETFYPLLRKRYDEGLPPVILTPHPGEFKRLVPEADEGDAEEACKLFAQKYGCITVLKKHKTLISLPSGEWYINNVGNDGMGKGGSGDVLTGLIAGFLAQGMSPRDAAVCGVYIHAVAGDIASEEIGKHAMLPTDIIERLKDGFRKVGWN